MNTIEREKYTEEFNGIWGSEMEFDQSVNATPNQIPSSTLVEPQRRSGWFERGRQRISQGFNHLRERWSPSAAAMGTTTLGFLRNRENWFRDNVTHFREFLFGAASGYAVKTAARGVVAVSNPITAAAVGGVAGGITGAWKEASRIRREQLAAENSLDPANFSMNITQRLTSIINREVWSGDGSGRRIAIAAGKGAAIGAVGALIGYEVTEFIQAGGLDHIVSNIQEKIHEIASTHPLHFNWGLSVEDSKTPDHLPGNDLNATLIPPTTSEIYYSGIDNTYVDVPGVGGEFSSLYGWEQAQIGNMILGDLGIKGPFDPYNLEHLKLLQGYQEAHPQRYARQILKLTDFIHDNNDVSVFHSVHQDLIAHGKHIKVPVDSVRYLRGIA